MFLSVRIYRVPPMNPACIDCWEVYRQITQERICQNCAGGLLISWLQLMPPLASTCTCWMTPPVFMILALSRLYSGCPSA